MSSVVSKSETEEFCILHPRTFFPSVLFFKSFTPPQNSSKPVKMMHQTSKFPFTFIPEASCQVSKAEKVVNTYNRVTCWSGRFCRISRVFVACVQQRHKRKQLCVLIAPWTDPGVALRGRGAEYADLFTLSNGGQHHRPREGGTFKVLVKTPAERSVSCPPSAGDAADLREVPGVDSPRHDGCSGGPGGPAPLQAGGEV